MAVYSKRSEKLINCLWEFYYYYFLVFFEGAPVFDEGGTRRNGKMASPSLFMNADHDHDNMDIRPT